MQSSLPQLGIGCYQLFINFVIVITGLCRQATANKLSKLSSNAHHSTALHIAVMELVFDQHRFPIGHACHVCRIWLDRVVFGPYSIEPDSAYRTGVTNQQTDSKTITPKVNDKLHECTVIQHMPRDTSTTPSYHL